MACRPPGRASNPPQDDAREPVAAEEISDQPVTTVESAQVTDVESTRSGTHSPADLRPARGYSWAPFEEGNMANLGPGAWSERVKSAKAAELEPAFHRWLGENASHAMGDLFGPMRVNYLRALAVVELLSDDVLATVAAKGVAAVPTRRFETLLSALRNERDTLAELGLTPTTRAAMAQTVASTEATVRSLADVKADGRATAGFARLHELAVIDGEADDEDEPA